MKQNSLCLPLLVFLSLALPACNSLTEKRPEQQEETVKYITKDIEAKQGTTFTLQLPSNKTTGYAWKIESLDTDYLTVLDHLYKEPNSTPHSVGVPGQEIWKLKAVKKGTTVIELSYQRHWITEKHGQHATITITII